MSNAVLVAIAYGNHHDTMDRVTLVYSCPRCRYHYGVAYVSLDEAPDYDSCPNCGMRVWGEKAVRCG